MSSFSIIYTLSAIFAVIALIILGDIVNMSTAWCRALLMNQSVRMWSRWHKKIESEDDPTVVATSRLTSLASERSILAVEKYLQIHDSLFPIRLLGIRADRTLIVTLVFGAISAFGVAVNVISYEI